MKRLPLLLLLAVGLTGCPSDAPEFPRDGFTGDDDDDSAGGTNPHGDLVAGDRIAWWDVIRSSSFAENNPTFSARASFFDPRVLPIPTPDLESCFQNSVGEDPWNPPPTERDYGIPYVWLDGEQADLELGADWWSANLSGSFWQDGADVRLGVSGADEFPGGTFWPSALGLPEPLIGVGANAGGGGIDLQWVAGVPENTLQVIVKPRVSGPTTAYVACQANDDGDFTIPSEALAGFPEADVQVLLRRQRINDDWRVFPDGAGRTTGISELRAEFTLL